MARMARMGGACGADTKSPLATDPAAYNDPNASPCKRWKSIRLPWTQETKNKPLPPNCRTSSYRQDTPHADPVTHYYCRVCMEPEEP
jgi:hypothetical protein